MVTIALRRALARTRRRAARRSERGIALMTTMMVTLLLSSLLVGFAVMVGADNQLANMDIGNTDAFYLSQAGLEKMTSDLGSLFIADTSPTGDQVRSIGDVPPMLDDVTFLAPDGGDGYTITFPTTTGNPLTGDPVTQIQTVSSGPFQGLVGLVTPYALDVTARKSDGSEATLRRAVQTASVPIWEFGLYSERDLAFFPGPPFSFSGMVHTNGDLYAQTGNGPMTFVDRVSALGEIVRRELPNGYNTTGWGGAVRVSTAPGVYRNLQMNEGSVVNQASSAPNEPTWTNVSTGSYNSRIVNGRTGSRRLALPLSTLGAEPIDLIRRPPLTEPPTSQLFAERHFSQASMRILLSDTQADLLGLPTATGTPPVPLDGSPIPGYTVGPTNPPLGLTRDGMTIGSVGYNEGYRMPDLTPVLGGFLKIEIRNALGLWTDVTAEILNLGIAGGSVDPACAGVNPNPNAVLRLQRIRDDTIAPGVMNVNPFHQPCGLNAAFEVGQDPNDYWPNVLYDSREGAYRDIWSQSWQLGVLGGTMHYVELDVNNLRRYLEGTIGATGLTVAQINSDGYLVYFSDRRGNRDALGQETGEFGFEDIVNWGFTGWPNAVKDPGEDINDNGTLDLYGQTPRFPPAVASGQVPLLQSARPWTWVGAMVGTPYVTRANPAIFFRRALKLTNGTLGNLPMPGLTVTSENPVYIQGDYNAAGGFGDPHAAAAVIADGVTMLVEQLERPQRDQLAQQPEPAKCHRHMVQSGDRHRHDAQLPASLGHTGHVRHGWRGAQLVALSRKLVRGRYLVSRLARNPLHQPAGERDVQVLQQRLSRADAEFRARHRLPQSRPAATSHALSDRRQHHRVHARHPPHVVIRRGFAPNPRERSAGTPRAPLRAREARRARLARPHHTTASRDGASPRPPHAPCAP